MLFLSPEGMREVDRSTIEGGTTGEALMEAAGRAVSDETWRAFPDPGLRLVVLCGSGNNGGDGFVAARELVERYRSVSVFVTGKIEDLEGDARTAAERYLRRIVNEGRASVTELEEPAPVRETLGDGGQVLVMDALLGTGTRGEIRGLHRELLQVLATRSLPVVAVDAPSGLDMGTGLPLGPAARATLTVTFGAAKLGHALGDGPEHTGRLVVRDIGLDPAALARAADRPDSARNLAPHQLEDLLPLPAPRAHKRSTGVVAVIAGSRTYAGAATLVCHGALRAGAGLTFALVAEELARPLTTVLPEVIAVPLPTGSEGGLEEAAAGEIHAALEKLKPDALAIGPGLGGTRGTVALVRELLGNGGLPPLVLDADGLNAFAGDVGALRRACRAGAIAITPHPGELGRLLGVPAREVDERRVEVAWRTVELFGCALLLKGAPTVIRAPETTTLLNLTGNQGLARGGTGDLLTGIAASLLAKRMAPFEALALAAFVHGLAGDLTRREMGTLSMTAGDVAERLPAAFQTIENRRTGSVLRASSRYRGLLTGEI